MQFSKDSDSGSVQVTLLAVSVLANYIVLYHPLSRASAFVYDPRQRVHHKHRIIRQQIVCRVVVGWQLNRAHLWDAATVSIECERVRGEDGMGWDALRLGAIINVAKFTADNQVLTAECVDHLLGSFVIKPNHPTDWLTLHQGSRSLVVMTVGGGDNNAMNRCT